MTSASSIASGIQASGPCTPRPTHRQLPLIGIAGSSGKSTVASMLEDIARRDGKKVAAWVSPGVFIDGDRHTNEIQAWERAVHAARAREVDLLIQELPASVTLGIGLRSGSYQVGVLTTICGSDDRCQRDKVTNREVEAADQLLAAISSSGFAVGNADDLMVIERLERTGTRRVLFAVNKRNPALRRHLESGGSGAWIEDGWLTYGTRNDHQRTVPASEVRASSGGAFTFQLQNALAALCCANVLTIGSTAIGDSLRNYHPGSDRLPESCNVIHLESGTIVVDSPSLVQSVRGLCRGVRSLRGRRSVVVLGDNISLGGEALREAARAIGSTVGIVILHGKPSSAKLQDIRAGLASSEAPPVTLTFQDERAALSYLAESTQQGDVALVLTNRPIRSIKDFEARYTGDKR